MGCVPSSTTSASVQPEKSVPVVAPQAEQPQKSVPVVAPQAEQPKVVDNQKPVANLSTAINTNTPTPNPAKTTSTQNEDEKRWCDLSNPKQVFTVEGVVKSCFANPNRKKFNQAKWTAHDDSSELYKIADNDSDTLLKDLVSWRTYEDFNNAKIQIHGTKNLILDEEDKLMWISDLQKLRWYGPFIDNSSETQNLFFKTATEGGEFPGFGIRLWTDKNRQDIELYYLNRSNKSCGEWECFYSNPDNEMGG